MTAVQLLDNLWAIAEMALSCGRLKGARIFIWSWVSVDRIEFRNPTICKYPPNAFARWDLQELCIHVVVAKGTATDVELLAGRATGVTAAAVEAEDISLRSKVAHFQISLLLKT